jgi:hypothetical protein
MKTDALHECHYRCTQPKLSLSRTRWVRSPAELCEVRLGGWVEIFVGTDASPCEKDSIVCGLVVGSTPPNR